ncbi:MAG: hypothetical protein H7177_09630 [Rhizobacter sp.]|nr:hypothetical protein [Bacteriovorax sp.]
MTTDNQSTTTTPIEETPTYSKATSMGRTVTIARSSLDKTSAGMKTLSLRPTRSVKKNNSFRPTKKLR